MLYLLRSEPYYGTPDALGESWEKPTLGSWSPARPVGYRVTWQLELQKPTARAHQVLLGVGGWEPSRALLQGGAETYSQQMVLSRLFGFSLLIICAVSKTINPQRKIGDILPTI